MLGHVITSLEFNLFDVDQFLPLKEHVLWPTAKAEKTKCYCAMPINIVEIHI